MFHGPRLIVLTFQQRLGKDPETYPKSEGLPHVQVALKMKAKGGNARAGDVIPYIFCLPEGAESAKTAQSDRAHHRDELRKADSSLKIGRICPKHSAHIADMFCVHQIMSIIFHSRCFLR